jgi:acetamidase/formamidase
MAREHVLGPTQVHYRWDRTTAPAVEVDPGDTIVCDTQEVSGGQLTRGCPAADLARMDLNKAYPLAGPILVRGAHPGDALEIQILELRPAAWGWSGIIPGLGLLADDFPEPYIQHWDLSNGATTRLHPGVTIPLQPFCGVMGVAPDAPGPIAVMPPGVWGGNMDIRHLNVGTTLYLPVWVEGGLFSCGDAHATQGDGEVCVTGIECPMHVRLRIGLRHGYTIPSPQFMTPGPLTGPYDRNGYYATTGVGPDLMQAARDAVRSMITHLVRHHRMSREEAYILSSVAVDLKISEIVDAPNWIVSAYLPRAVFD